jgi:hypothetical protein
MPVLHPLPIDLDISFHDTLLLTSMLLNRPNNGDHLHATVLDLDQFILPLLYQAVIHPETQQQ